MNKQRGFILLEVLIAIIIISVGVVAVAGVFLPATASYAIAGDYTVASNLAQKQLELLKSFTAAEWDNALAQTTIGWQGEEAAPNNTIRLNSMDYGIETTVKVPDADTSNSLIQVTVKVSWTRSKSYNSEFVTLFSKN